MPDLGGEVGQELPLVGVEAVRGLEPPAGDHDAIGRDRPPDGVSLQAAGLPAHPAVAADRHLAANSLPANRASQLLDSLFARRVSDGGIQREASHDARASHPTLHYSHD